MDELDMNQGDLDMITYWLCKYEKCKTRNEAKAVLDAAKSFLEGDALMVLYDSCLEWHYRCMEKSIYRPG